MRTKAYQKKIATLSLHIAPHQEIIEKVPLEAEEQADLVKILRRCDVLFFAVPNGGYRRGAEAAALRRQGVVAGAPDLVLPIRDNRWTCLAIEMKRQVGGVVSPEQRLMHEQLRAAGWLVLVCCGCADAVAQLTALGVLKTACRPETNLDRNPQALDGACNSRGR
jgi:hypothetical protein